jgi:hypothetical protein
MGEKAWSVWCLVITMGHQVGNKPGVINYSRLWKPVHSFANFYQKNTIVNRGCQVLLLYECGRNVTDRYANLFIPIHWVVLLMLNDANLVPGVETTLLKSMLAVVESAVGVLTFPGWEIRLWPTVKRIRRVSAMLGFSSATIQR